MMFITMYVRGKTTLEILSILETELRDFSAVLMALDTHLDIDGLAGGDDDYEDYENNGDDDDDRDGDGYYDAVLIAVVTHQASWPRIR